MVSFIFSDLIRSSCKISTAFLFYRPRYLWLVTEWTVPERELLFATYVFNLDRYVNFDVSLWYYTPRKLSSFTR